MALSLTTWNNHFMNVTIALNQCILKHKKYFLFKKSRSLERSSLQCKHHFKAGLHYSDYRSKLVHFEAPKNIFYVLKSPSLERLFSQCNRHFMAGLHYSNYRSKLVHFEAQKILFMLKKALAQSYYRRTVNTTLVTNTTDTKF